MKDPCKKCLVLPACSLTCEKKILYQGNKQKRLDYIAQLALNLLAIPGLVLFLILGLIAIILLRMF